MRGGTGLLCRLLPSSSAGRARMSEVEHSWATAITSPEQRLTRLVNRWRQQALLDSLTVSSGDGVVVVAVAVFVLIEGSRGVDVLVVGSRVVTALVVDSGVVDMACGTLTMRESSF